MAASGEEQEDAPDAPEQNSAQGANGRPPVNFGKRLAHTDKVVRDRGFAVLKKWMEKHPELDRMEYLKLWKGLYFGMWMADKRPVQQELCVGIALLLNVIPEEKKVMWVDTFWEIMHDHWDNLDKHRMSKYHLFLRIVMAEVFKMLRLGGWEPQKMKAMGHIFAAAPLEQSSGGTVYISMGLHLHWIRVFWDELQPQLAQQPAVTAEALLQFLEPFIILAETSRKSILWKDIHEHLLKSAPEVVRGPLHARLLEGAARNDIHGDNREALYDTAGVLGKMKKQQEVAERKTQGNLLTLPQVEGVAPAPEGAVILTTEVGKKRKPRKRIRSSAAEQEAGAAAAAAAAAASTGAAGGESGAKVARRATP